jgi:hypothetical protein
MEKKPKLEQTNRNIIEFSFIPLIILVTFSLPLAVIYLFHTFVAILGGFFSYLDDSFRNSYQTSAVLMIIFYLFYCMQLISLFLQKINLWFWLASSVTYASHLIGVVAYTIYLNKFEFYRDIYLLAILVFLFATSVYYFYFAVKFRQS